MGKKRSGKKAEEDSSATPVAGRTRSAASDKEPTEDAPKKDAVAPAWTRGEIEPPAGEREVDGSIQDLSEKTAYKSERNKYLLNVIHAKEDNKTPGE